MQQAQCWFLTPLLAEPLAAAVKAKITICRLKEVRSCGESVVLKWGLNGFVMLVKTSPLSIVSTWSTSLSFFLIPMPRRVFPLVPPHITHEMASDIERVKYFPDRSWDAWQTWHDPSCYITKQKFDVTKWSLRFKIDLNRFVNKIKQINGFYDKTSLSRTQELT